MITGNLDIISNSYVKILMNFDTKFRLNSKSNFNETMKAFNNDINIFIKNQSYKNNLHIEYL